MRIKTKATVFVTHGVVRDRNSGLFCHRPFHDWEKLNQHLASRPEKYVSLADALKGCGDALTIDDATEAAKEAAQLAIGHGHAITLFVNPAQVEAGRPYFFHQLNFLLDATRATSVDFNQRTFALGLTKEKRIFREYVKQCWSRLPGEVEKQQTIEKLAGLLNVSRWDLPPQLRTLNVGELRDMHSRGIAIENHGWDHCHYGSLTEEEQLSDIGRTVSWLESAVGIKSQYFAVPFGDVVPRRHRREKGYRVWFTLTTDLFAGRAGEALWNRATLRLT